MALFSVGGPFFYSVNQLMEKGSSKATSFPVNKGQTELDEKAA